MTTDPLFENFRNYIREDAGDVRAAYDRFLSSPQFRLVPRWSGPTPPGKPQHKRSVAFTRPGGTQRGYYSFIVNLDWLLFYLHRPAEWTDQRSALVEWFRERFNSNPAGEWKIRILSATDVQFLEALSANTPWPLRPHLRTGEVAAARGDDPP